QYRMPQNYELVMEALKKAHREDLIGFDKHCLIRPRQMGGNKSFGSQKGGKPGAKPMGKGAPKGGGKEKAPAKKKTIRNVHKKKG
ncbi:MAG: DUF3362 domain-containing protein, partial [Firmicutes bacterium]|nr:DUF3362 domain-containing protein [Bacillota bacterium]